MSLPSRPLCRLWHHWPRHPDLMPLIFVRFSWLCSELVWILSICQMWQPSIFLVFLFLWCSSRLCSWSFAFHHAHHSLSTLISSLSLNHHLYADDTKLFFSFHPPDFDSNITHLQNALQQISSWMTANHIALNSSKTEFLLIAIGQNTQLLTQHHPLCSQSSLYLWWTSFLFWSDLNSLSILLLSHLSTSLNPSLPRLQNSLYHCHLHRPLQTWLL